MFPVVTIVSLAFVLGSLLADFKERNTFIRSLCIKYLKIHGEVTQNMIAKTYH